MIAIADPFVRLGEIEDACYPFDLDSDDTPRKDKPSVGEVVARAMQGSFEGMTSDIDILRTAEILVNEHGEQEATLHAAMRADELLGKGDLDGAAVWRRVIKAIDLLTTEPPADAEVIRH